MILLLRIPLSILAQTAANGTSLGEQCFLIGARVSSYLPDIDEQG